MFDSGDVQSAYTEGYVCAKNTVLGRNKNPWNMQPHKGAWDEGWKCGAELRKDQKWRKENRRES